MEGSGGGKSDRLEYTRGERGYSDGSGCVEIVDSGVDSEVGRDNGERRGDTEGGGEGDSVISEDTE